MPARPHRLPLPLALALLVAAAAACDDVGDDRLDGPTPVGDMAPDGPRDVALDAADPIDRGADDGGARPDASTDGSPDGFAPVPGTALVRVTLDGAPVEGARVMQGGTSTTAFTDAAGLARIPLDEGVVGDLMVIASHPEARQRGEWLYDDFEEPVLLALRRFGPDDPTYRFQDPGEPRRRNTTAQCGHCHLTINDAWFGSAHQRAAQNPIVHDIYAGTAAFADAETCAANGGAWRIGRLPGRDEPGGRCYLGDGLLPALNPECGDGPCPDPQETGGCADCHAPAIDGALGGRDLLEARGIAHDYGISCDVCHRVEAVLDDGPPGIAGRLRLHRPSDAGPITLGAGGRLPLTFGPSHDSPNPRMGSVQRDHYRDARICSGCHELDAPAIDRGRWPDGRLPVQSTWSEWRDGPLADAPCQSCHMPPEPGAANAADLQAFPAALVGIQAGWYRPPGAVRRHIWSGPRVEVDAPDGMVQRAAALFVRPRREGDRIVAAVEVRNVGAGHALPTGEPMRQVLLTVDATCDGRPLPAVDGDVVPAWGGAVATQIAGDDWRRWPAAQVGDVIRVVQISEGWHDYPGFGPFGDGTFSPAEKGMPVERFVGAAAVIAVEDGAVLTEPALPEGDRAYLTRGGARAGAPGFGFARIMVDGAGRIVPHFLARDVRSDNRLLPNGRWTSTHAFDAAGCAAPTVVARLEYRAWPWDLGQQRGWTPRVIEMARVAREVP